MTAITQQQIIRDLGQYAAHPKHSNQPGLVNYQSLIEHGGRIYRVSILTAEIKNPPCIRPISELIQTDGAHVQIEVFAQFATARFFTQPVH